MTDETNATVTAEHRLIAGQLGSLRRIAQALANAEARGAAKATWATRVLDAWATNSFGGYWERGPGALESIVRLLPGAVGKKSAHFAKTTDAAAIAAALAVYPSLPAEVRAELGEPPAAAEKEEGI